LVISLLLSLFLVPALSANPFFSSRQAIPNWIKRVQAMMQGLLLWSIGHKKSIFVGSGVIILLAFVLAMNSRASLLPPMDEGSILIEYIMPPGTSLQESNRIGNELEQIAMKQKEVASVYRRTGSPAVGFQVEGPQRGELMIKLKPLQKRTQTADEIMNRFRTLLASYTSMSFLFHNPTQEKMDESFSGLPALFGVTIYGDDGDKLIELSQQVEALLKKNPSISNIVNNTKVQSNQLVARMNTKALALYGLNVSDVNQTLRAAGLGVEATQVVLQQESIPVLLRWGDTNFTNKKQVENLPLLTPNQGWIPLQRVAYIEQKAVAASVTRLNGQRQITLLAEADGNLMAVAQDVQTQLNHMQWPQGYSGAVSGQYPVIMKSITDFAFTAFLAVLFIYLIMVFQFNSWLQPLAILSAIPFTLAGGVIVVSLFGHGLDATIGMGALTLIGIAVNNGIVLVNEANRFIEQDITTLEAWQQAVDLRLRPILMTSATTIVSLVPILLGIGGASEIFQPFALMVSGGLITGLLSSMLLLPAFLMRDVKLP